MNRKLALKIEELLKDECGPSVTRKSITADESVLLQIQQKIALDIYPSGDIVVLFRYPDGREEVWEFLPDDLNSIIKCIKKYEAQI